MNLATVLVNNQLDEQFFFLICLFQSSTCFEQPCAHHQESQLYQYDIWHMSLWKQVDGLKLQKVMLLVILDHPLLYRVTWTTCIDTTDSWWWAHGCLKHVVENWNKHIRKKKCASSWLFTRTARRLVVYTGICLGIFKINVLSKTTVIYVFSSYTR